MFAELLLQVSMFVAPLYLGEEPPESRSVRALRIDWDHSAKDRQVLLREPAAAQAKELAAKLRAGSNFDELSARARAASLESGGAVLGTFFPGLLAPPIDQFLFHAAEFDVSDPIETDAGFQIVQRIDRFAGCRAILIEGTGEPARTRSRELLQRLAGGADFAEMARANSADKESAQRGGALGIFERGPSDVLLKAAVFQLRLGEIAGPIESPLGLHLIQRVDPAAIDHTLADDTVARVRMILISYAGARGAIPIQDRKHEVAERLARDLVDLIRAGQDMAELAAKYDDDSGGRERRGDVGWIRRRTSQANPAFDHVFTMRAGDLADPIATSAGWLVLRRER